MPTAKDVDVVVIGGGPAGTSTAMMLARSGQSVAVLERSSYETARVGETLPPAVKPLLDQLGVWERFQNDGHTPSPGIVSLWGRDEPYENDFVFDPYGHGWHIDRRRFDEMLALAAEQAGATVYRAARVIACTQDSCGDWRLAVVRDGRRFDLRAAFLIDGAGRSSSPVSRSAGKRIIHDRLVGVVGFLRLDSPGSLPDHRTLVEAGEEGWWYSARLPEDRLIVAFMTDADLVAGSPRRLADVWRTHLQSASHTRARVESGIHSQDLRIVAANTYHREGLGGPRWLTVGDAATAFDPLSSQGIYKALQSGLLAARAIQDLCHGHSGAVLDFTREVEMGFAQYLKARADYYGRERRWPDSAFWRRRHSPY